MTKALRIIESLKLDSIVCVFDQAIYSKAAEIKWREPEKFSKCILMMGIFHLLMTYMNILNKRFADAGLFDTLLQSSIVAEGSINRALSGKQYNRGIRLYKLFYEALMRLLLSDIDQTADKQSVSMIGQVSSAETLNADFLSTVEESEQFQIYLNGFIEIKNRFRSKENVHSLQRFWMSFLDMMDTLLNTIYAVRRGNWDLLLESIRDIIPFFFAYDHINYARYTTVMLADMLSLPDKFPDVYAEFKKGNFSAQISDGSFSRVETDKIIEMTLNKDTKTPGGTTGFSTNPGAVKRWELNASYRAALRTCFHKHLNYQKQVYKHPDLTPSRIERDNRDVCTIVEILTEAFINPFSESPLVCISTGIVASETLSNDILNAKEEGTKSMEKFIIERLSNERDKSFYDPLKKLKLKTFRSMNKCEEFKCKDKTVTLHASKDIFLKIAIIAQKRSVDLKLLFRYPLGPLPLSLAEPDGTLKKTVKSSLMHKFEEDLDPVTSIVGNFAFIADGMACIRQLKVLKSTYAEFAVNLLNFIFSQSMSANRIDIVFDVYIKNSIKDIERQRRTSGELVLQKIIPTAEIKQWNSLLSHNENKNKLVIFIVDWWMKHPDLMKGRNVIVTCKEKAFKFEKDDICDFPELFSDHEEADTRILLHAAHASFSFKKIVLFTPDTDILIMALAFSTEINADLIFKTGTKHLKRMIDITSVASNIDKKFNKSGVSKRMFLKSLIGFHCFTGCDTISAFAGKGKIRPFSIMSSRSDYVEAFVNLGNIFLVDQHLFSILEMYVCDIYGKNSCRLAIFY